MDQTFMTIHNLGPEANILFASESIADILGYQPAEVQGKSCFDYFHPDEVSFARSVHSRGVLLDKAAVLHYARILSRDGRWIGCECCFTIVHDVLVACTSIYRRSAKSERRAIEAPQIRRIFSCSPRDPRYHMLEHLSPKFRMSPTGREPRAALILNRFTRNLTIMFATTSIASVIGLQPNEIKNRGFYRCIQERCLAEAIECLESAKANDSIAYLRFYFRDPRVDGEFQTGTVEDNDNNDITMEGEEEDSLAAQRPEVQHRRDSPINVSLDAETAQGNMINSKVDEDGVHVSMSTVPAATQASPSASLSGISSIELEAVVSCTSDGLVVILRKARPSVPPAHPPLVAFDYADGLFVAPWGQQPIRPHFSHESLCTFQPPLLPQHMPLRDNVRNAGGPPLDVLMNSIRDVAVFAWGVVGINPAMAAYGNGQPSGEAWPNLRYQQNCLQMGHGACGGATTTSNSSVQSTNSNSRTSGRKNTPETVLVTQAKENSCKRSRSRGSYNALDPVARGASSSPCGLQSAWPNPADRGWDSTQYRPDVVAKLSSFSNSRVQQVSNNNSLSTLCTSRSCSPSISRDVWSQSVEERLSASRNITPPNTASSIRVHRHNWR